MKLYFDTAYVAKCYLNEDDSAPVSALAFGADRLYTSYWWIAELTCAFQSFIRESQLTWAQAARLRDLFLADVEDGISRAIFNTSPPSLRILRAGDAIWSNRPAPPEGRASFRPHGQIRLSLLHWLR